MSIFLAPSPSDIFHDRYYATDKHFFRSPIFVGHSISKFFFFDIVYCEDKFSFISRLNSFFIDFIDFALTGDI